MPALLIVIGLAFVGLGKTFRRSFKDPEFRVLVAIFTGLIGIGTLFYHHYERLSWLDSMYFSVITLSTVGYGDITPQTPAGKVFTMIYILIGVSILVGVANILGRQIVSERLEKKDRKK